MSPAGLYRDGINIFIQKLKHIRCNGGTHILSVEMPWSPHTQPPSTQIKKENMTSSPEIPPLMALFSHYHPSQRQAQAGLLYHRWTLSGLGLHVRWIVQWVSLLCLTLGLNTMFVSFIHVVKWGCSSLVLSAVYYSTAWLYHKIWAILSLTVSGHWCLSSFVLLWIVLL